MWDTHVPCGLCPGQQWWWIQPQTSARRKALLQTGSLSQFMAEAQYFIPVCFLGKRLINHRCICLSIVKSCSLRFLPLCYLTANTFLKQALTSCWLIPPVPSWIYIRSMYNRKYYIFTFREAHIYSPLKAVFGSCMSLTSATMTLGNLVEDRPPAPG